MVEGSERNFYGTTEYGGGSADAGTVFSITPGGAFSVLYRFQGGTDGAHPTGRLVMASDGNLYGMTSAGARWPGHRLRHHAGGRRDGAADSFSGDALDGAFPAAGLIQGADGGLYGTTQFGGILDLGTVFRMASGIPPATSVHRSPR